MNKLKTKVFFTIYIIMTLFLTAIIIATNIQNYNVEKKRIENSLSRINENRPTQKNSEQEETFSEQEDNKRMFIDQNVYTIVLEDGNVSKIISHSLDYTDAKKIKKVANKILENGEKGIVVSNLYFNEYSYSLGDKMIIIADNSSSKERLIINLRTSIIIFIIIELLIILVTYFLTNWIIKPVEEAWKKQKEFIADASHELKTPLSVIMANAEMLDNNPKEKKWLKNIQSESERMNKLITNLLDLAKLENSDDKEIYTEVNLSKLIEKSILHLKSLFQPAIFFPINFIFWSTVIKPCKFFITNTIHSLIQCIRIRIYFIMIYNNFQSCFICLQINRISLLSKFRNLAWCLTIQPFSFFPAVHYIQRCFKNSKH